jgi:hypothetical protein
MPATIQLDSANLYRVQASGLLRLADMQQVQSAASEAILQHGKIKLLFILDRFEGWEKNSKWGDMGFYIKHDKDLEKIAIVGDEQWRDEALMFAGAGLRKAAVEYFTPAEIDRARAWLA